MVRGERESLGTRQSDSANSQYRYANTETAVGHATLVTGADPSRHGIIANDWIDRQTGAFVYNTEDDRHRLIGRDPKPDEDVSPHDIAPTLAAYLGIKPPSGSAGKTLTEIFAKP